MTSGIPLFFFLGGGVVVSWLGWLVRDRVSLYSFAWAGTQYVDQHGF